MQTQSETGCCPIFNPEPWQEKEVVWDNKLFVKDRVKSFFHIPLNFPTVMKRSTEAIHAAEGCEFDNIVLSDENSLWGADVFLAVNKEVPNIKMETISGAFLTKAFEGHYKDMRKWMEEMKSYVKEQGREVKKMYFYYTTCPKCAKAYGKNYVVILAQI